MADVDIGVQSAHKCDSSSENFQTCYMCPHCGAGLSSESLLQEHLKQNHETPIQTSNQCYEIDNVSNESESCDLPDQVVIHAGRKAVKRSFSSYRYVCKLCPRTFASSSMLNVHYTHTHHDKPQYDCEVCGKGFAVKRELATHRRLHEGQPTHHCDQCHKEFGTKQLLRKHELWHTGERTHICAQCNKAFFQKGHLTQHLMIHAGGRNHACHLCPKTFIFKFDLNRHMKIHAERVHSSTGGASSESQATTAAIACDLLSSSSFDISSALSYFPSNRSITTVDHTDGEQMSNEIFDSIDNDNMNSTQEFNKSEIPPATAFNGLLSSSNAADVTSRLTAMKHFQMYNLQHVLAPFLQQLSFNNKQHDLMNAIASSSLLSNNHIYNDIPSKSVRDMETVDVSGNEPSPSDSSSYCGSNHNDARSSFDSDISDTLNCKQNAPDRYHKVAENTNHEITSKIFPNATNILQFCNDVKNGESAETDTHLLKQSLDMFKLLCHTSNTDDTAMDRYTRESPPLSFHNTTVAATSSLTQDTRLQPSNNNNVIVKNDTSANCGSCRLYRAKLMTSEQRAGQLQGLLTRRHVEIEDLRCNLLKIARMADCLSKTCHDYEARWRQADGNIGGKLKVFLNSFQTD